MANKIDLTALEILSLVEIASLDEGDRPYATHSKQLIAFAALAVVYGNRTGWYPTEFLAEETRCELSNIARSLQLDKTAYQTFVIHMRRMVRKFCDNAGDDAQFLIVKNAKNEQSALNGMLDLLATKNIFTAGHMRTWSGSDSMEPVDLTRRRKETRSW